MRMRYNNADVRHVTKKKKKNVDNSINRRTTLSTTDRKLICFCSSLCPSLNSVGFNYEVGLCLATNLEAISVFN
jgi:hypothetical protein